MPTNDLAWVGFSVEIGPEGGVYILDWHDTDVCGNKINFPNSGRVYRIMPKSAKVMAQPNLPAMSDAQLVQLQTHRNDWYVRHSRTLLQSRAANGSLDKTLVHRQLTDLFQSASTTPQRLRALWALQVTGALDHRRLAELLGHEDAYVRGWSIQFLCEANSVNAFQDASSVDRSPVGRSVLASFASMANNDRSPIVRLYLTSAVQRLPFADRWRILEGLASHDEDIDDNNLPRMVWFGLEPMVPSHPHESLQLAVRGKIPMLQEFVARRMTTGNGVVDLKRRQTKQTPEWQWTIQKVAPGFKVRNVGEGGVVHHKVFRNAIAVQTHPLNRNTPSSLVRTLKIPKNKTTRLRMRVSHHPHGDWQLRVLVAGEVVFDQIVGSKTVSDDEWLDVSVDLTKFAGRKIELSIENRPNDWRNEWAYWNDVRIVSD
jgi:hypothetical protein